MHFSLKQNNLRREISNNTLSSFLVKLQRRRGDMVKTDKSWKKVCFSQWNIWLSDRLLLEWYNKTTKKTEIVTSWGRRQKKVIFSCFFRNHENSQAKNPVNGKQTFLKKCLFWRFFEKSDRTNFFFGNGLIEPKNWWKAPYRIVDIPYKTQKRHFSTETVIFGPKKSACGKPPAKKGPKCQLFLPKKRQKTSTSSRNGHLSTFCDDS